MERSIAQKSADKRYAEKIKGKHRQFAVNLVVEEYDKITQAIDSSGMSKAEFLRWAVAELQKR